MQRTSWMFRAFSAIGGNGSGAVAVTGTITVLKAGEKAYAYIAPNANVEAEGNVIVLAESNQDILVVNGNVSASGAASLGVATNVIIFSNKTHAYVGGGATVTANANKGNVNFVDGTTTSKVDSNYKKLNDQNTNTDYVSSKSNESAQSGVISRCEIFSEDPQLGSQWSSKRSRIGSWFCQCTDIWQRDQSMDRKERKSYNKEQW